MKVKVFAHIPKQFMGNIYWTLPGDPELLSEVPDERLTASLLSAMKTFRGRGYFASCFPEGDGIAWEPLLGQSHALCIQDIAECFGWDCAWGRDPNKPLHDPVVQAEARRRAVASQAAMNQANEQADARALSSAVAVFEGPVRWTPVLRGLLGQFSDAESKGVDSTLDLHHPIGHPVRWNSVLEALIDESDVTAATGEGCGHLNTEATLLRLSKKFRLEASAQDLLLQALENGERVVNFDDLIQLAVALCDGHNLRTLRPALN